MQDLASKVGGREQKRSCSPLSSLNLQRYEMVRYRAIQGQTLDELHLLRRKKKVTSSSPTILEIALSLVLESFAPPTLHCVVWWLDRRRNTMFCHR